MKYKLIADIEKNTIEVIGVSKDFNHPDQEFTEPVGQITGQDKKNIIKLIRKEAFIFDDSTYEIFVGIYGVDAELLAVDVNKKVRVARHVCWLMGKNRDIVLKPLKELPNCTRSKEDLEADFIENGVGNALNK